MALYIDPVTGLPAPDPSVGPVGASLWPNMGGDLAKFFSAKQYADPNWSQLRAAAPAGQPPASQPTSPMMQPPAAPPAPPPMPPQAPPAGPQMDLHPAMQLQNVGIDPSQYGVSAPPPQAAPGAPTAAPQPPATTPAAPPPSPPSVQPSTPSAPAPTAWAGAVPNQFQAPLASAIDTYGGPYKDLLTKVMPWVGQQESGWNPDVGTNKYGATGMFQFKADTAKEYGIDPSNPVQSINGAVRKMVDLLKAHNGDPEAAIADYGTFSTGQGPTADDAVRGKFQAYMGQKPGDGGGQPSPIQMAQADTPLPAQSGYAPAGFQVPYPDAAKPNRSSQLLALASGLLSGPTLGRGLGKGLQAMTALQSQDRSAQMQANSQAMSLANMQAMMGYRSGQLANQQARTGIMAGKPTTYMQMPDGSMAARLADGSVAPLPGVTSQMLQAHNGQARVGIAQQNADTNASNAAYRQDPNAQGAKTQAQDFAKKAATDIQALQTSELADEQAHNDNQTAMQLIDQHPDLAGPTLKNRATRALTEMGVIGDPSDLNALTKATAQARNSYLNGVTNGHMGALRAFAADKFFSQAVADVSTSPAAAKWIIEAQDRAVQARQAWRDQYSTLRQNDPGSVTGQNYYDTMQKFYSDYAKKNPLPAYTGSGGTGAPSAASAPSNAPSTPPQGPSKVLRYDAQGNLIQ